MNDPRMNQNPVEVVCGYVLLRCGNLNYLVQKSIEAQWMEATEFQRVCLADEIFDDSGRLTKHRYVKTVDL